MITMSLIRRNILFLSLMMPATLVYAEKYDNQQHVPCLSVDIIQNASSKIDAAQKINDKYIVYTSTSVLQMNNLWWYVGVGGIPGESSEVAIRNGKEILQQTNIRHDVYATKKRDEYICKYGPGRIEARGKDLTSSRSIKF